MQWTQHYKHTHTNAYTLIISLFQISEKSQSDLTLIIIRQTHTEVIQAVRHT